MAKKKTEALTEVVDLPKLPGIEGVNKVLLGQAVNELNQIYTTKSVETACAIGDYLLETFFDGEIVNFNEWGGKHQTFGQLARMAQGENSPLHISASGLWYSVRILEQVKTLPKNVAMALPVTHHRMLIPVKDVKLKERLAKRAVEKGVPSRTFQDEVREVREKERKKSSRGFSSGRPPLPVWIKAIKHSVKAVEGLNLKNITKTSVDFYDEQTVKTLLSEADKAINKIQKIKSKIKEHVE